MTHSLALPLALAIASCSPGVEPIGSPAPGSQTVPRSPGPNGHRWRTDFAVSGQGGWPLLAPIVGDHGDRLVGPLPVVTEGTQFHLQAGDRTSYALAADGSVIRGAWYDLGASLFAVVRTARAVKIELYEHGHAQRTWVSELGDVTVTDAGMAASDANVAWVWLARSQGTDLMRVNLHDGSAQIVTRLPSGIVLVAPASHRMVVLTDANTACESCTRAEMRDLDSGSVVSSVAFPMGAGVSATLGGADSEAYGFDGAILWHFSFTTAHSNDVYGGHFATRCAYAVFDLGHGGTQLRTLSDATGEWARLSTDCAVVSLQPTADGGVVAEVIQESSGSVLKFDGPP